MAAFSGVYAAAVTPRREGPEADLAAAFELIDALGASGVNGLSLMGSTGEFVHFTFEERTRLVSLAIKRSRVPVIVGAGHSTLDGALALARAATDAGAEGILLPPPYFFPYGQGEIAEFYLRFADEFHEGAPILLDNIPAFATPIASETAIGLLRTGRFAGIQDSSGDWDRFERLNAARRDRPFTLLCDDRIFRRARQAGADGAVSGCACAVPEVLLALDCAVLSARDELAERVDAHLHEFTGWIERFPPPIVLREATALRGRTVGPHAIPLGAAAQARLEEFREWFRAWWPAVLEECRNV
jgi:4-hydroxy-tetrahydrodipicolinate synthase